jgi:hypothetical protein
MARHLREATSEEAREEAFCNEYRSAPRVNGVESMPEVARNLRRILVRHFPERFEPLFNELRLPL